MRKSFLLITAFFFTTQFLLAQQDTITAKNLDEVVVTGEYKPSSVKNSVYQVKTITKERILQQGAARLQDVLSTELNIRFSQDQATGGSNITMMGLAGVNVKILVDGLPVIGRQGTSNEININQIDINSIERIEIVEGPMSVVYGSDALAGVINIITKKSLGKNWNINARLHEETVGNEYGIKQGIHNQHVSGSWHNANWEFGASVGKNYFGGWKDTAIDRELIWHKKDQLIANGFLAYHKNNFFAKYRIDGLDEIITNPGNFSADPNPATGQYLAYDQEYLSQRVMHQLQSGYELTKKLNLQLQSSYTTYSRQVFSTVVDKESGNTALDLGKGRNTIVDFAGFSLRAGATYTISPKVSLQPGIDINTESGEGERLTAGKNKVSDYAFFLTSEILVMNKIKIRPGLRVIKNSVYNAPPLIPSLNAKIDLTKNMNLRFSYARGFRAPTLRELYFNFFDANHQIIGNPDLLAETSNSFNTSVSWQKISPKQVVYTTRIGGFYSAIKNMIGYTSSPSDPNVFQLNNISKSKTGGINLQTVAKYKIWSIAVGASYAGFYNTYSEEDKVLPQMVWSPEANATVGHQFPKIGLGLNLFYKFTGVRPNYVATRNSAGQRVIMLSKQQSYHITDFTFTQKITTCIQANGGVRNLFDVTSISNSIASGEAHAGNGNTSIATGRSFFLGLTFNYNK